MNKSLHSLWNLGTPRSHGLWRLGLAVWSQSMFYGERSFIYWLLQCIIYLLKKTPHMVQQQLLFASPPLWPKHNSSMSYNSFRLYCFQLWSIHFALLRKEWRSSGKHHCQFWRIHDVLKSTRVKGYQNWKGSLSEEQCGGPEGQKTKILRGFFSQRILDNQQQRWLLFPDKTGIRNTGI